MHPLGCTRFLEFHFITSTKKEGLPQSRRCLSAVVLAKVDFFRCSSHNHREALRVASCRLDSHPSSTRPRSGRDCEPHPGLILLLLLLISRERYQACSAHYLNSNNIASVQVCTLRDLSYHVYIY